MTAKTYGTLNVARLTAVVAAIATAVCLACAVKELQLTSVAVTCIAVAAALLTGYLWRASGRTAATMQNDISRLRTTFDMRASCVQEVQSTCSNSDWQQEFFQLRDRLFHLRSRLEDDAHSRASVEVRMKRLRSEQQRLTTVIDSLSDAVIAADHYDEIVLFNPAAKALLEINSAATGKLTVTSAISNPTLRGLILDTRKHKHLTTRTCELEIESNGATKCFRATCHAVSVAVEGAVDNGNSRGVVVVLTDISAQKVIQKRNAEFVSSVSHEMKTPLSGIKAYVELLADGEDEDQETRDEFLDVINNQADRLQRLIDNLLNLARIEAGVVEVNKQQRALNEVLEEAISVVQPSADAKDLKLRAELSPMYLAAFVDRDMLLQSAINLLSNAIKYTSGGGQVTLRSRMTDDHVVFEVEDSGVGLTADDCARVFEKFYRVKKDQQMAAGTGLGLPLAKHIVEDVHGGHLTVESRPGKGSIFRVMLPPANELSA